MTRLSRPSGRGRRGRRGGSRRGPGQPAARRRVAQGLRRKQPGRPCKTPWDFCCEEPKEVAAHSASVQVVGPDGKPLRFGLQGAGGMKPLSEVTVKGTVAKGSDSGTLIVNATGIHVKG